MLPLPLVRDIVERTIHPGHFFAGRSIGLAWEHAPEEEVPWQIFHGRLVEPRHSREWRRFEAWHVWHQGADGRSAEPLLSVKLDAAAEQIHVVRAIHSYVWEPVAESNVIHAQEARRWVRELVGTIDLKPLESSDQLGDELARRLFQAVVGTSRLALTSVEAPLPAFTFGQLAYFFRPDCPAGAGPMRNHRDLIDRALLPGQPQQQRAKLLETLLRSTRADDLADAARRLGARRDDLGPFPQLFVALFDEVALSPYTDFVDQALQLLAILEEQGSVSTAERVDILGTLLRRLGRHLTAFDLVTFHNRGANYPDALLLDALLRDFLRLAERRPDLFNDRLRRRALRQGWLLRRHYEGHLVPDAPTSEGENCRVLPHYPRVPEEQIVNPARRSRRLFQDGDPLSDRGSIPLLLRQSIDDLAHPAELRELGTALFLDRPLGVGKRPGAPDQTPLLSYVAFSRSVAERRLRELNQVGLLQDWEAMEVCLARLDVPGIAVEVRPGMTRPGVASLADTAMAASDFVLLRTTPRTVEEFLTEFDFTALAGRFDLGWLRPGPAVLILGGAALPGGQPDRLLIFDAALRPRLELEIDARAGFRGTARGEGPAGGLRLLRVWDLNESDLSGEDVRIPIRESHPAEFSF